MPRTTPARALAATLLACALVTGLAGCGDDDDGPRQVGKVLDTADTDGRRYRQVPADDAPEVGLIVQPDPRPDGGWDVRVRMRNFRFSPEDAATRAVRGRGYAQLYLDGSRLSLLRAVDYRLPGTRVSRGTHKVTVRLYADDGTVWAVEGEPVEATADLTASGAETASPSP
ncbi:hypothetical protein ABT127_07610 [Streptomyces sp. NPDC001904]|uniref:hypothetical protein n=1 Tax=Streptomyces sp. NPDC001904 TaxID=3154531 RepID=UPI003333B740